MACRGMISQSSKLYIYREVGRHIIRQSKGLPISHADKVLLVCTRQNGNLILKGQFVRQLKSEEINAHSFRHTHATQLIESGANAKGVATRLGHADATLTQNLYTHNTLKLQEEAAVLQTIRRQTFYKAK